MRATVSTILILILLLSNTGLVLSSHSCGGKVTETKVSFGAAEVGCSNMRKVTSCVPKVSTPAVGKKTCCENEHSSIVTDQASHPLKLLSDVKVAAINYKIYLEFFLPTISRYKSILAFSDSSPPEPEKNFQTAYQSFLI